MGHWRQATWRASASELHALDLPDGGRHLWVLDAIEPALVLGSTQPDTDADAERCAAEGVALVRRRSGGGAVLVGPGECTWVDVLVPHGDPLWHDDVGRATWWLGDAWCAALDAVGRSGCTAHRGPLVRTRWSPVVCFAGLGPGEVIDGAGAKVVGISQRRTRTMARFQCAVPARWEPDRISGLLRARPPADELGAVTTVDRRGLIEAFAAAIAA